MKSKKQKAFRNGSATPTEVYLAVGSALSWWESTQDIIEKLFLELCSEREPDTTEEFRKSRRKTRERLLRSALEKYLGTLVTETEAKSVVDALENLEKLVVVRNQIAHGYVQHLGQTYNGERLFEGNFLTPALNIQGDFDFRDNLAKDALTAGEIDDWRDAVRAERGKIDDVWTRLYFSRVEAERNARLALDNDN